MLKMGCIIAAEVYIEDNPTREGNPTSVGLLIPYKAIQFDNPIVTQTTRQGDQTISVNLYDAFVGMLYTCYKVLCDKNRKIKQVLLNDSWRHEIASFESMGAIASKIVTVYNILRADTPITYTVFETNIPDEIEEVLHFGGRGWFLEDKG